VIRKLSLNELDKLIPAAKQFYSEAGIKGNFNQEEFQKSWEIFISSGMGEIFALIDENTGELYGGIGCVKVNDPIIGALVASEMFWYVINERRGEGIRLFNKFEEWAEKNECSRSRMIHLSNIMPNELRHLYERRGYKEIEIAYERIL